MAQALEPHRSALLGHVRRLERLIGTVDKTINHLKGKYAMNNQEYYEGFSEEVQKEYAREARQRWGSETGLINRKSAGPVTAPSAKSRFLPTGAPFSRR